MVPVEISGRVFLTLVFLPFETRLLSFMNATQLATFNAARLSGAYGLHGSAFSVITSTTTLSVTGIQSPRDTSREYDPDYPGYERDHSLRVTVRKTSLPNITREMLETCSVRITEGSGTRDYKVDRVTDDATAGEWVMQLRAARDGT
jgi:hypothetical protein